MFPKALFETLIGKWEGVCRTWFEADKLEDESNIAGEISASPAGRFLRHLYHGAFQGKPRQGDELIAYNSVTQLFQVAWIDDFHMSKAILFSEGKATERGFSVRGNYDVGENHPQWGWRTEFDLVDKDHLLITAYNIEPHSTETKAVETDYRRVVKK